MQQNNTEVNKDLQAFILKFEPAKFKLLPKGIEIRGINDLHSSILEAKAIIEKMGLRLTINHNAEMLSYRGFEVNKC
ncbi:hypothetical protein [Pedobacter aquatilis]|uniref:hypothetical protein n=1 Tax=Pedobacter aquatilis TaxID=351343 RepID=UPI00292DA68C|nr:hypothetical protein [Pedobacter aquatilis]